MLEEVQDDVVEGAPQQWEYKMNADRGRMHHVDIDEINALGEDGWELLSIVFEVRLSPPEVHFYFKRPLI